MESSLVAAEKDGNQIAVEIKSFIGLSAIYDFHLALGQYRNYQLALLKTDPNRILYLAVPEEISEHFFSLPFVQDSLVYNEINYLVYDSEQEIVLQWKRN